MNRVQSIMLRSALLCTLLFCVHASSYSTDTPDYCEKNKLTVYKVVLNTYWSRDRFPNQYPEWRPFPQWSKVVGRSHNSSFSIFKLNEESSEGLQVFAETGRTDILDEQAQGEGGVYDEFIAPPILNGEGRTEAEFFVDGTHSKVSLLSRMVPSPDWFVGLSGFDLCSDGKWISKISVELPPLDAGTDNGFTYTSPNWPTNPKQKIRTITSRYPNDPSGSFFYPKLKKLPLLAELHFYKMKQYQLSKVFNFEEKQIDTFNVNNNNYDYEKKIVEASIETNQINTGVVEARKSGDDISNEIVPRLPERPKLIRKHPNRRFRKIRRKFKNGEKPRRLIRQPRDCIVSEWGEWSTCSKKCGIGESLRTRTIVQHARRGGRNCPLLNETKWCGSQRNCNRSYFDWKP